MAATFPGKHDCDSSTSRYLSTHIAQVPSPCVGDGRADAGASTGAQHPALSVVECAGVAQSVEHVLGKDGVTGSIPVSSSVEHLHELRWVSSSVNAEVT